MQIATEEQVLVSIPIIKEFLVMISALGLGIAFFLGVCWGLSCEIEVILAHTTSTQMVFLCFIGVGLFHAGRRYLQRATK